jgi:hypothetical protein
MSFSFPSFVSTSFSRQGSVGKVDALPEEKSAAPAPSADDASERRIHQRFVARLHGEPCFWALVGDARLALNDLSLKGFSMIASPAFAKGARFHFTLQREGVPDAIRGRAEVTGLFGKDEIFAGCRIVEFEGDDAERLHDWLVTHVIRSATVRITEKDASAIVAGHSLV